MTAPTDAGSKWYLPSGNNSNIIDQEASEAERRPAEEILVSYGKSDGRLEGL